MGKQYPVRREFSYSRIGSWSNGNPYTIMTVFPQWGYPFVLKGGIKEINAYIKSWGRLCFTIRSYWHHGKTRGYESFKNVPRGFSIHIGNRGCLSTRRSKPGNQNHYYDLWVARESMFGEKRKVIFEKTLRRLPQCWPKEIDKILMGEAEGSFHDHRF